MLISRTFKALILCGFLGISGCTAINSGVGGYFGFDTDLKLTFKVDADINPDERKKPSPLFIRLYELKSSKMFNKADFIDIYERDAEVLGADMIAKQKLRRLKPGEDREDSFVLDPKTRYVALYAEFLRYQQANYRVIIPVVPNNVVATDATIQISGNNIKVLKGAGYEEEEEDSKSGKYYEKAKKGAKKAGDTAEKAGETAEKAGEAGDKLKKLF